MIWEMFQQSRNAQAIWAAQDAKHSAREAQLDADYVRNHVQSLEQQVERLTLAAMAMAEILRDRLGITESEIEGKIREIDLRDGRLDGKLSHELRDCSRCHRPNGSRRRACLYCGESLGGDSILFRGPSTSES